MPSWQKLRSFLAPLGSKSRARAGIALVMVLLVLMALLLIGIPFVASMLLKEKTNKNSLHLAKSRIAAASARNYAIASLVKGCATMESGPDALDPFNTPDYDDQLELETAEMTYTNVADPKGIMWSVRVQDEQSKINILGAPKGLVDILRLLLKPTPNLMAFEASTPQEISEFVKPRQLTDKLGDFMTEYSYRPTPWVDSQNIIGYQHLLQNARGKGITAIYLPRSAYWYGEKGVRVRLTLGNKEFIALATYQPCNGELCRQVNRINPYPLDCNPHAHSVLILPPDMDDLSPGPPPVFWRSVAGMQTLVVDRRVPDDLLTPWTTVEVEQAQMVNVNTAPVEVLTALLWRVGSRYFDAVFNRYVDERITLPQAQVLAGAIKAAPFRNQTDWLYFIDDAYHRQGILVTATQVSALWTNSRWPRAASLFDIRNECFTGTLPFCYRSFDTYDIRATGIANLPSGTEAARTTFREIVDVSPRQNATFALESQYDFDEQFNMLMGNYRRLTTLPKISTIRMESYNPDTMTPGIDYIEPDYSRAMNPDAGEVRLKTADDLRGVDADVVLREHDFDGYQGKGQVREGYEITAVPLTYTANSIETFQIPCDPPDDRAIKPDLNPGGVEFWIKLAANPAGVAVGIADIRQADYENRISISYDNNELALTICDATVERKTAKVVAAVMLSGRTWYHIGAYWKGTKYADMALFLDGKPVGDFAHYNDLDRPILTELSADISLTPPANPADEVIIPVRDTTNFPPSGVIEVGEEAIEYSEITGSGFKVWTAWNTSGPVPIFMGWGCGARGTTLRPHPAGAKVSIYGYANVLAPTLNVRVGGYPDIRINYDPLQTGGATLAEDIPNSMPQTSIPIPININPTDIEILAQSVASFPNQGYLKIDDEVIFYARKEPRNNSFQGCRRGLMGTSAQGHAMGAQIELFSIKVTDNTDYYSPGMIQIDDEWIGPVQKGETSEYFTGVVGSDNRPVPVSRGMSTMAAAHSTGAVIIPVLSAIKPYANSGDTVTIVESDQSQAKEEMTIRHAIVFTDPQDGRLKNLFAFTENISRSYPVDNITRIMKFPSGELPSYLPADFNIGGLAGFGGATPAIVDEIKFLQNPDSNYRTISDTVLAAGVNDRIQMNPATGGVGWLSATGGMIKMGDEVIGYCGLDTTTGEITGCVRGYLNSPVQGHDYKQRVLYLPFLPVTELLRNIGDTDSQIPVAALTGFSAEPAYLLIGNDLNQAEMVGYSWQDQANRQFLMPDDNQNRGIFRGAFGTTARSFIRGTLVYAMPFRYWHLERSGAFHEEMAYFQTAHFARGATWERVRWTEVHEPGNDGLVQWRFLARFDGMPHWAELPTNRRGGLFGFSAAQNLGITANQIELLGFVRYQPGAFQSDAWKRTPSLANLYIDFSRPDTVVTHQEE